MDTDVLSKLVDENPRIILLGFKSREQGLSQWYSRELCPFFHEVIKEMQLDFELYCEFLRRRKRIEKGTYLVLIKIEIQHWLGTPDVFLGIVMLAMIHMGYKIRKVQGSEDARVIGYQ